MSCHAMSQYVMTKQSIAGTLPGSIEKQLKEPPHKSFSEWHLVMCS